MTTTHKLIITAALVVALCLVTACTTTPDVVTHEKAVVVIPQQTFFDCPKIEKWPDPDALSDADVARLLVKLAENNQICASNMESIHKFLDEAKKATEALDRPQ